MTTNNADPQAPARPAAGVPDCTCWLCTEEHRRTPGADLSAEALLSSANLFMSRLPDNNRPTDATDVHAARQIVAAYLRQVLAAPAPEPVDRQGPVFGIRPEVLLRECLKPDEISGDRREARVAELLSWFSRFADGYANPKWLRGHAFELAYVLAASAPAPSPVGKSLVRRNAERDPDYRPYCMRCPGLVRMRKVEDFYWRCRCGAEHDERTTAPDADGAAGVVISDGEVGRALHAALHALVSRAWERQDHAGEYDRVLALFGTLLLDADDVARLRDRRRHPTLAEPTR